MPARPPLHVIVLAAGQGTRMRSDLPKVLHGLAGRPLLAHVTATARALDPVAVHVVHGHGGEQVRAMLSEPDLRWVEQASQLGTGHAVAQALPNVPDDAGVLVLYGDVPLVRPATLSALHGAAGSGVAILTTRLENPRGYGRIVRDDAGAVQRIVEEKDAHAGTRAITEVNTGMLAAPAGLLRNLLAGCDNRNAQEEYYLTDVVGLAVAQGSVVQAVVADDPEEVAGVNNRLQLAACERAYQLRQADALMLAGVTLADPGRLDVRGELVCEADVSIDVNCIFEGTVHVGAGSRVGPGCLLRDCIVARDVCIEAYSVIDGARLEAGARVGPFARLRPETVLGPGARAGNFVELKKAEIGAGSKVNHLSYVGDAILGEQVNIGAGTITCNYDGVHKHRTRIGDGVFIGSDTQLVAPVTIGDACMVAAGTTVTRDAEPDSLVISRTEQTNLPGWSERRRRKSGDSENR